jgi:hypothetical protein
MLCYSRFATGDYDHLVIDWDGTVCIEYNELGAFKHVPVQTSTGDDLKVGDLTIICDRREKSRTTKYKLKHK